MIKNIVFVVSCASWIQFSTEPACADSKKGARSIHAVKQEAKAICPSVFSDYFPANSGTYHFAPTTDATRQVQSTGFSAFGYHRPTVGMIYAEATACQHSQILDLGLDADEQTIAQRIDKVADYALGRSEEKILAFAGSPAERKKLDAEESKCSGFADSTWTYYCSTRCLKLYFKRGTCIGTRGATKSNFTPGAVLFLNF